MILQGVTVVTPFEIYQEVGTQESETIQAWIFLPNDPAAVSTQYIYVYTTGGATEVIEFYGHVGAAGTTGKFSYHGGDLVTGLTTNAWYHVSICWERTAGGYDPFGDGALAQNKCRFYIDGTKYGDYNLSNNNDPARVTLVAGNSNADHYDQWTAIDAIAYSWDGTYSLDDNLGLEEDATISNSNVYDLKIHHPTTLKKASINFGGQVYEEWFPIAEARISSDEGIFLGCTIKITDTLTSSGASASEVIFKGVVMREIRSPYKKFVPRYLIYSNAMEMNSVNPDGEYTKDTDGYISDILTNDCSKLTEGTLQDGADLGTFTASGDKKFALIIRQCARLDGFISYIDSSAGADNADLMYNDGSTDTGVDIDESSVKTIYSVDSLDEHVNRVTVRGGIQSDGTRANGTANDTTSQGLYDIVPTWDTDTTLNTDALCASKAAQILADNEFGNKKVEVLYKDATKGMLQPGETVTFDWDSSVKNIGFNIEQEQYIIALNVYDVKNGLNKLTLFSSIYYDPLDTQSQLEEISHVALQNTTNIATNQASITSGIKRSFSLGLNAGGGATGYAYYVVVDAVGEQVGGGFMVSDNIDASEDITITLAWYRNDGNADTIAFNLYVRAIKTDGTEASSWNIENATGISLAACAAARFQKYTYTISSADYEQGDAISIIFSDNEAARSIHVTSLDVQYTST